MGNKPKMLNIIIQEVNTIENQMWNNQNYIADSRKNGNNHFEKLFGCIY